MPVASSIALATDADRASRHRMKQPFDATAAAAAAAAATAGSARAPQDDAIK